MEDSKLRVIDERAELDGQIEKLDSFINHSEFFKNLGIFQQTLLKQQLELMNGYSNILSARLRNW